MNFIVSLTILVVGYLFSQIIRIYLKMKLLVRNQSECLDELL